MLLFAVLGVFGVETRRNDGPGELCELAYRRSHRL